MNGNPHNQHQDILVSIDFLIGHLAQQQNPEQAAYQEKDIQNHIKTLIERCIDILDPDDKDGYKQHFWQITNIVENMTSEQLTQVIDNISQSPDLRVEGGNIHAHILDTLRCDAFKQHMNGQGQIDGAGQADNIRSILTSLLANLCHEAFTQYLTDEQRRILYTRSVPNSHLYTVADRHFNNNCPIRSVDFQNTVKTDYLERHYCSEVIPYEILRCIPLVIILALSIIAVVGLTIIFSSNTNHNLKGLSLIVIPIAWLVSICCVSGNLPDYELIVQQQHQRRDSFYANKGKRPLTQELSRDLPELEWEYIERLNALLKLIVCSRENRRVSLSPLHITHPQQNDRPINDQVTHQMLFDDNFTNALYNIFSLLLGPQARIKPVAGERHRLLGDDRV